jgi:hypothetical protein
MANINPYKVSKLKALNDTIVVSDMYFGERISAGGIILRNDDTKSAGIRPRWGKVYAVGPNVQDIKIGQYICVSHGRWTRGIKIEDENGEQTIRKVDPKDVLLVSDEPVNDATLSDKEL